MEKVSCPQHILDNHNEEHAKPGSLANQLAPGMEGVHLTEGDCALEAFKASSSDELQKAMDEAPACQELGKCILDRAAVS